MSTLNTFHFRTMRIWWQMWLNYQHLLICSFFNDSEHTFNCLLSSSAQICVAWATSDIKEGERATRPSLPLGMADYSNPDFWEDFYKGEAEDDWWVIKSVGCWVFVSHASSHEQKSPLSPSIKKCVFISMRFSRWSGIWKVSQVTPQSVPTKCRIIKAANKFDVFVPHVSVAL